MSPWRRSLILAMTLLGALAASASAGASVSARTATRLLHGRPCAVTARLSIQPGVARMIYRGRVSCRDTSGEKTLDLVPQVYRVVNGHRLWFTISLAGRYQGPTAAEPLSLVGTAPAVAGHVYRLLVYARVSSPGRRTWSLTVCAGCAGASRTSPAPALSIRPRHEYAAAPASTALLRGRPCVVAQTGLDFTLVTGSYVVNYGGYATCGASPTLIVHSLRLCVQVAGQSGRHRVWYTVGGSCLNGVVTNHDFRFGRTGRTAFQGHAYRIVASAQIRDRTARGTVTRRISTHSAAAAP